MNNIILLAAGLCIPLLAIVLWLIRRLTVNRPTLLFDLTGKTVLYLLPVFAVLGLLGLLLLKNWNLLMLSVYLVVAMVAGPFVFLWYCKHEHRDISLDARAFKLLVALYFAGFAVSVVLLRISVVRPYLYYGVIAIMATLLLLQIVLFDARQRSNRTILLQISSLVLNIIWGMSMNDYYYIGRTDILAHAWYVDNILKYGHVTQAFGDYQPFPLWHILSGALYMITSMTGPVWEIMYIASGLIYVLIPLGIYLIVLKVTKEQRIALLSALFTSFYPFFTLMGSEAMARSIVSAFGVMLILLLLDGKSKIRFMLACLLTLCIIVFHTVAIMFVLIIMAMIYLAQKIFVTDKSFTFLSLKYFIVAIALTLAYWTLFAGELVDTLLFNANNIGPGISANTMADVINTPVSELLNYIQYSLFLFFIIIGIVYLLRSKKIGNTAKILGIMALALIPLTFPGPALMLNKLFAEVELDRFFENGFLFMAMAAGAGFYALFYRSGRAMKAFLALLFAVLVLLSVSNDFVATDNPLVKRPFFTHYLTAGETSGADRVADLAQGNVMTDFVLFKYLFNSPFHNQSFIAQVSARDLKFLKSSYHDLFLIRDRELSARPLYLFKMAERDYLTGFNWANLTYYPEESGLWNNIGGYDRVFDTNAFGVYR